MRPASSSFSMRPMASSATASRAQYDTMSIESGPRASSAMGEPEPVICSCCGKVSAQPRYTIFFKVKSFIFVTTRSAIQGIFAVSARRRRHSGPQPLPRMVGLPLGPHLFPPRSVQESDGGPAAGQHQCSPRCASGMGLRRTREDRHSAGHRLR
jgi:hypothetical protein